MARPELLALRLSMQVPLEVRRTAFTPERLSAWRPGVASQPRHYLRAKRIMDVLISVAVLLLALPVILLCALAVKLESRGPALVRHPRIGLGGRRFDLWRLRTTEDGTDLDLRGAAELTAALTRVGRVLRRTHIDELPALINVLRGEMSIVGPVPVAPSPAAQPLWSPLASRRWRAPP